MNNVAIDEVVGAELDGRTLRAVADHMTAMRVELSPDDPPVTPRSAQADLHAGNEIGQHRRLLARADGQVVGMASVYLALAGGNEHIAELEVEVHPEHRRRRIGTSLVARAVEVARDLGRTSLTPWGTRSGASDAFWSSLDLPEVQVDRLSRVAIGDVDADVMARWRSESRARALGYELHRWRSPCPADLLGLYLASLQGMNDAPLGDLDMTHPVLDESWCRAREATVRGRGGSLWAIAATAPDGRPAAMTEVSIFDHRRWLVGQQGTATLEAHRRLGLGRWLKAEMFADIVEHQPDALVIETGNADSNAPMLSINTEMGFRLHRELTTRQADLVDVEAGLARRGHVAG